MRFSQTDRETETEIKGDGERRGAKIKKIEKSECKQKETRMGKRRKNKGKFQSNEKAQRNWHRSTVRGRDKKRV